VIEVKGGALDSCLGNYEDFLRLRQSQGDLSHSQQRVELGQGASVGTGESADKEERKRIQEQRKEALRVERRRQKELTELEARIEFQEQALAEVEGRMADPELYRDPDGWRQASDEHARLKAEIDALYPRWEELQLAEPDPESV
jgi:ATP-binding cassette subfamily F protein 3